MILNLRNRVLLLCLKYVVVYDSHVEDMETLQEAIEYLIKENIYKYN